MQQRGVPAYIPELAADYGEHAPRDQTTYCIYFSKRSHLRMRATGISEDFVREIESRKNLRFIVAKDTGVFLTVEYVYKEKQRIKKDAQRTCRKNNWC
jgi:hypothetical protein